MKKMSVKMQITLWYACFVIAISLFVLGIVAALSESLLLSGTEKDLIEHVREMCIRDRPVSHSTAISFEDPSL